MYLKVQGLVLRVTNYNDTDALLTVLTHSYGKLTIKARGLRRKNSPLAAPCQLLAYNEFMLFEYRGMYVINEAYCIDSFPQLQKDITKLSLCTYFAQVAEVLSQEDTPNPDLLSLVLNCLYATAKLHMPEKKIKAVFELRSACVAGYTPDLFYSQDMPVYFDISEGKLVFPTGNDYANNSIRMPLNPGALEAMRYICSCDSKQLFAFQIGEVSLEYLSNITESYLMTRLERSFSTLDFYKTLLM